MINILFKKYKFEILIFLFSLILSIFVNYNSEVLDTIFFLREYKSIYHSEDYFINLTNINSTLPVLFNYIFYNFDNWAIIGFGVKFLFNFTSFISVY